MKHFECDYAKGAHPEVLQALIQTNLQETAGYGQDPYCAHARALIMRDCARQDIDVHFLVGGTQTNAVVIASALKPYQGVVSAESGHINVHETGAVEACGHKVLTLPARDGKLDAKDVAALAHTHFTDQAKEHTVCPAMVYLSFPTEWGTLYTKQELKDLRAVCDRYGMYLFIDGARLGYGLMAQENDVSLSDLCNLCDVFSIGGTKVGALFGEAVVIVRNELKRDFRYHIKQRGAMLAKGRLLGVQFAALFEHGLYYTISRNAVLQAQRLKTLLLSQGLALFIDSPTNQQFFVLPNRVVQALSDQVCFELWQKVDETHSAVRICTDWATTQQEVDTLSMQISQALCAV